MDRAAVPAESLEAGEMRRLPFGGELLGAVRVRSAYAAIPLEAFDRAAERLEAEAQAAYLHLLRLSVAEGRNFCRVGKRELGARLRLSERRLLGVLDALVAAGFARPLHRDNRGTLWRVYLPAEAAGEQVGDDVLLGRAARAGLRLAPAPTATPNTTATPTPTATASPTASTTANLDAASLARALARARGRADGDGFEAALREVRELLAEGQRPQRIAAAIESLRRRGAISAAPAAAGGAP